MKRIELNFVALLMIFTSFCMAAGAQLEGNTTEQVDVVPTSGHINASETQSLDFDVGSDAASVSFILYWGDETSDLDMLLITPGGAQVNSASDEMIIYNKNVTMLYYIVPMPEPGSWTAEITAKVVPETGIDYMAFMIPAGEEGVIPDDMNNLNDTELAPEECVDCAQGE